LFQTSRFRIWLPCSYTDLSHSCFHGGTGQHLLGCRKRYRR
jgi:hypothetical protein